MSARNRLGAKRFRKEVRNLKSYALAAPAEPKPAAVKLFNKLASLTLRQLGRRLKQSARKSAQLKNIVADLAPNTQFSRIALAAQTQALSTFKQIRAEIHARKLHAEKKLQG